MPAATASLEDTLAKGVWTPVWRTAIDDTNITASDSATARSDWHAKLLTADGSRFQLSYPADNAAAIVEWSMSGMHNVNNALVAVAAAYDVGVSVETACAALSDFAGIKRRMELIGNVDDILIFDDFAHHPTAITTTLDGAKKKLADRRIWAIIEPRSNTMKMGIHQDSLAQSAALATIRSGMSRLGWSGGLKKLLIPRWPRIVPSVISKYFVVLRVLLSISVRMRSQVMPSSLCLMAALKEFISDYSPPCASDRRSTQVKLIPVARLNVYHRFIVNWLYLIYCI